MKELSIFIDESGDFGEAKEQPAYYLVTFVFHNQDNNIDQQVTKLEKTVRNAGFSVEYIHTGPVIRREEIFAGYSIDERRKLLYKMLNFVNSCPISYLTVAVNRKEAADKISLSGKLAKKIYTAINEHQTFFMHFDRMIVYYDNGQQELSAILNAVFSIQFPNVEFRKAEPQKYRLLQAADFICSMELLKIKKTESQSFWPALCFALNTDVNNGEIGARQAIGAFPTGLSVIQTSRFQQSLLRLQLHIHS